MNRFIKIAAGVLCSLLLQMLWLPSSQVLGHGYVSYPASRSSLCKTGDNQNCGAVQYEPQSVEGDDGFPEAGPLDGTLAAAGKTAWTPLNEQSAQRWAKTEISSGNIQFQWLYTAPHVTKDWKYYITLNNWDANQPLTRASFEPTAFCVVEGNMQKPSSDARHDCTIPERSGYHVILAVWDVGDTAASFYQAIDVSINGSGGNVSPPADENSDPTTGGPEDADSDAPTDGATSDLCAGLSGSQQPLSLPKSCRSLDQSTSDQWCTEHCSLDPSFCPKSLCECSEVSSEESIKALTCQPLPGSGADATWCTINCNSIPAFCPEDMCRCTGTNLK